VLTQAEMDRQAALVPGQAGRLTGGVGDLDDAMLVELNRIGERAGRGRGSYDNAAAVYMPDARQIALRPRDAYANELNVRGGVNTRWYAPCGHEAVGVRALIAHEFGHHVTYQGLYRAARAVQEDFWQRVAGAFGVPAPTGLTREALDRWISQHRDAIEPQVSIYGSSNSVEMLAEVWQEYSTNPNARGPQRIIGDLLKSIGEAHA
jgi:hypothetical protein